MNNILLITRNMPYVTLSLKTLSSLQFAVLRRLQTFNFQETCLVPKTRCELGDTSAAAFGLRPLAKTQTSQRSQSPSRPSPEARLFSRPGGVKGSSTSQAYLNPFV